MTRLTNRFVAIAGFLALTGTAAFAQNLKGDVPFAFTVSGKTMPAGQYEIARLRGDVPGWVVRNVASNRQAIVMAKSGAKERTPAERGKAALDFACAANSDCGLQALYPAGTTSGFAFPYRIASPDPNVRVASIRVTLTD